MVFAAPISEHYRKSRILADRSLASLTHFVTVIGAPIVAERFHPVGSGDLQQKQEMSRQALARFSNFIEQRVIGRNIILMYTLPSTIIKNKWLSVQVDIPRPGSRDYEYSCFRDLLSPKMLYLNGKTNIYRLRQMKILKLQVVNTQIFLTICFDVV